MYPIRNVDPSRDGAKPNRRATRHSLAKPLTALLTLGISVALLAPERAHAVDGCVVLLCLAAPSWRNISECVPPVRQLLRDLARGRPFPSCAVGGAGNTSSHAWASAPGNCPQQC